MKSLGLKYVFVFVLGMSLILSACGTTAATEAPASNAVATDAAATMAPASGDVVAAYVFTNTGTADICNLYLSPTGLTDWGADQLGGATLPAGQTFTLKNIPAGSYDAKVVGCKGEQEATMQLDIKNP